MSAADILAILDVLRGTVDRTAQVVTELEKISGSMAEQETRAQRFIRELFDKSPILMRANMYKVYTIDTTSEVARKLLANVFKDFGYHAAHMIVCLNAGAGTANIYLNANNNDPILLSDLANVREGLKGLDIREIYYDVTTGGAGTAKLLVGAWVK